MVRRMWDTSSERPTTTPATDVRMAPDIFGGRMEHEVDPEGERLLEDRRRPGIVDEAQGAVLPRQRRQSPDIVGLHGPARRAFEIEELGARQRGRDGREVAPPST